MTAQRYVHDILQLHVLPLMQWLPEANFQQDNVLPHMQGCHKTVSALLLPFLGLPDPQICVQSSISGIIFETHPPKAINIPPLSGHNGIIYSDDKKAKELKNTLEESFQENAEPYNEQGIKFVVESEIEDFLTNSNTSIPPLTSRSESKLTLTSRTRASQKQVRRRGPVSRPIFITSKLMISSIVPVSVFAYSQMTLRSLLKE
ncbi:hypothetical protein TNCV_1469511 [Trichonephila clavipes]|nr:hypothetical protein TNCV_1469511 [Trichonephila clavipes]